MHTVAQQKNLGAAVRRRREIKPKRYMEGAGNLGGASCLCVSRRSSMVFVGESHAPIGTEG